MSSLANLMIIKRAMENMVKEGEKDVELQTVKLEKSFVKISQYDINEHRIICYTNGDLYQGNLSNGNKHGIGRYEYHKGNIYFGEFQDERNGIGIITFKSGNIYKGMQIDGLRNGFGIYSYKETDGIYSGYFVNDSRCGFGIHQNPICKGMFDQTIKENRIYGVKYNQDGEFWGTFDMNTIFDGIGFQYENGFLQYAGFYKNQKKHGFGAIRLDDEYHEGLFSENKMITLKNIVISPFKLRLIENMMTDVMIKIEK